MISGLYSKNFSNLFSSHKICGESINISIEKTGDKNDESYTLLIDAKKSPSEIKILCSGEKSAFRAICGIKRRIDSDNLNIGEYHCSPSFEMRGYIEGFYGNPWSFEKRVSVMKLMAENGMNTVYYAPKDDDYHRDLWREKYPEKELNDLKNLVDKAKEYYMDFHWCVAPGLSINYSSEKEFALLKEKSEQLYSIGIRNFGLLLDDIDEDFVYENDKEKYGETVNAHIDLINRFFAFLRETDKDITLTVCPTLYHGKGTEYYISKLGKSISPDINIFWTGRDICSRDLTSEEAKRFIESTNHKPLYWDNYPVNDCAMFNEMHLSPIMGRDKDLGKYSKGLISNCMEYAECSKIPLITIADYLWSSENYDYEMSWKYAIGQIIGRENVETFMTFADHMRTSCLMDGNSAIFFETWAKAEREFRKGNIVKIFEILKELYARMYNCRLLLEKDIPLFRELSKWIKKYNTACDVLESVIKLENGATPELVAEIESLAREYETNPARLTEDMDIMLWVNKLIEKL